MHLFAFCLLSISMVDALTLFTPYWFKKQYFHPNGSEPIRISMVNNSPRPIEIRTKLDVDSIDKRHWVHVLLPQENVTIKTSIGYQFIVLDSGQVGKIVVYPGKHIYQAEDAFVPSLPIPETKVRVVSSLLKPGHKIDHDHYEAVWRDAIRSAALRRGVALCFCGAGNQSSTYSIEDPGHEFPALIDSSTCGCDLAQRYNFLLPCNHGRYTTFDMYELTYCPDFDEDAIKETRVYTLDGITFIDDRMCEKAILWITLAELYGRKRASMIMPVSYDLRDCDNQGEICERSLLEEKKDVEKRSNMPPTFYIIKNSKVHRQKGIKLTNADDALNFLFRKHGFEFATEFVDRPFLYLGYKMNLRRYLLIVCTGKHARAYVHRNGKNFYGKLPYRELWNETYTFDWKKENLNRRLLEIITTAYDIPEHHYDDKPMKTLDFLRYLEDHHIDHGTFLRSLHTRLGLSLHMASLNSTKRSNLGLCEPRNTPTCLVDAIRAIHIACDFHVEQTQPHSQSGRPLLSGHRSYLFECNRGPDMTIHDPEDGSLKREVSADFISFLGFNGPLDDNEEALSKHNLVKIYDSEVFDVEKAFEFLESLQSQPVFNPEL